jgi:2-oxoglutarate ferredoxin oxidoreductase subunit delta
LPGIKIDRELCKGCELCVHFCPKGCIKMEGFNSKGYKVSMFITDEDKGCTGCAVCARICPDVAIVEVRR